LAHKLDFFNQDRKITYKMQATGTLSCKTDFVTQYTQFIAKFVQYIQHHSNEKHNNLQATRM